ncbi:MAG TPA: hypothetical protein VNX46_11125, partial [Candidatus Acidoferrum sp.]|nr:hypothetical protein [Candidatus Acidoferrum sp.]
VAEYLRAGGVEKPATEKLLEKLALPTAVTPAAASAAPAPAPVSKVDEQKLAALAQAGSPAVAAEKADAKAATEPAPDLAKADEKLSSLLGNKK